MNKCPSCGAVLSEFQNYSLWDAVMGTILFVLFIYLVCTVATYLIDLGGTKEYRDYDSFFDVFRSQWEFIKQIRMW